MATVAEDGLRSIDPKRDRLVIFASMLGTVFEWYDFFIYGTLATVIGTQFFPAGNDTISLLIVLATFGVGFGMRPLGALLFGVLGDRLGRKYTFLVTIVLMGGATAAVGLLPGYAAIGMAAPILLVFLRVLQGLALGGEYGGAAIYVAEHAPRRRRGLYTSFIQAGVVGGFLLSLGVILGVTAAMDKAAFDAWGWRIPFLLSLALLAVSLWVRMMLSESPVFKAMKAAGATAKNPLRESFDSWAKVRRLIVAMLGLAAGMTVLYYTALFQALYFLQNTLKLEDTTARMLAGTGSLASVIAFIFAGWLSDKVGRKLPTLVGYAMGVVLMFPIFHFIADAGNPQTARAMVASPVVVTGSDCRFDPFASKGQATPCGQALEALTKRGVPYQKRAGAEGAAPTVAVGATPVDWADAAALDGALKAAGYRTEKVTLAPGAALRVVLGVALLGVISGLTFGPLAAWMVELFPARVRYTSMSVPYHIGAGYFGGFLPFISMLIVAKTGDPFAGLWYTVIVAAMAFVIALLFLPETSGKALD